MREIVLDTETTGLDPAAGHRLVEIAGVELWNRLPTGQTFHVYINPERDVPDEAFRIHGLSTEFLSGQRLFAEIADDFLVFVSDSPLVIHNAEFDMRFLNAELERSGRRPIASDRAIDTLLLARTKFPGASNSLDALCGRFRIDSSRRVKHGALLDSQLLAEVYGELTGGRQSALILVDESADSERAALTIAIEIKPRSIDLLVEETELVAHRAFVETLGPSALWRQFESETV